MAKSTVNLSKRLAEMQFFSTAEISVSTPEGDGIFYGITYSRSPETDVLAKVCFGKKMTLIPLENVTVIKGAKP
jgi:hypothetical protein